MNLQSIRLDPDGGDVIDTLSLVDISRGGIGAIATKPLYRGQRLVVCMPVSQVGGRRSIYGTVVNCRQDPEGYRIGLQFDSTSVASWCDMSGVAAAA